MEEQNTPAHEDTDDLLLSCRYGDLDDLKSFLQRFGPDSVADARDENGNTVLHMASANGHIGGFATKQMKPPGLANTADARLGRAFAELLHVILPIAPSSLLSAQNNAGSTALHWAVLNAQLGAARALVSFPGGPGPDLIDIKNSAGRSPLGEAEAAGWDEGAKWMVEVMRLDDAGATQGEEEVADAKMDNTKKGTVRLACCNSSHGIVSSLISTRPDIGSLGKGDVSHLNKVPYQHLRIRIRLRREQFKEARATTLS
ncbi:hypothetical protein EI94DRAFT_1763305 [Lactarius quietus]|nr:hypothetical protein EI94DRAFT_1763305 [Lactarius quietus]